MSVKDISKKRFVIFFTGKRLQLFCAFSVCILDKFSVRKKKGKLMYLGIQFLISRRKLTFLCWDSKSHLLKGSKTFPYLHEPNTANVSKWRTLRKLPSNTHMPPKCTCDLQIAYCLEQLPPNWSTSSTILDLVHQKPKNAKILIWIYFVRKNAKIFWKKLNLPKIL